MILQGSVDQIQQTFKEEITLMRVAQTLPSNTDEGNALKLVY